MATIGVALTLPDPWRSEIQAFRERIDDPMADLIPPHITLIPPIDLAAGAVEDVERHLEAVAREQERFDLALRGTGTFRPVSQVVFLALSKGISNCEVLAGAIRTGPLAIDLTFPYHPHVTIAYDRDAEVLDTAFEEFGRFEAAFTVRSFQLYRLRQDRGWEIKRDILVGTAS